MHTSAALQSKSARDRTKIIATEIMSIGQTRSKLSIASFTSGHSREIEYLSPTTATKIDEFLAIDTDRRSLNEIKQYDNIPVKCINKNVFRMCSEHYRGYDFVYSLGLFDYLNEKSAMKLLGLMWDFVASGGRLIIANLNNDAANLGYCEAIMDWWMITRTEEQLMSLISTIGPRNNIKNISVKTVGCFSYLTLDKK